MNISITFDIEIWCNGWEDLDRRFPSAFQRYVYGQDRYGYALPKTLEILNNHQLKAVFFVEPLFSYRFGIEYLKEVVALITDAGQEVQLHLHPEWTDETNPPLLSNVSTKRPNLSQYTFEEQKILIERGIEALVQCGLERPTAFRAGNFGCNRETLRALAANGIFIDSSLTATNPDSGPDFSPAERCNYPKIIEGVTEYPITIFRDGFGRPRHWQVGAVGFRESIKLIDQARRYGYPHLVLVSHNFEMLIPNSSKPDPIVVSRFQKLCEWLENHSDAFPVVSLDHAQFPSKNSIQTIHVPFYQSASRLSAQIARRFIAKLA